MFSLVSRLGSAAANVTFNVVERTIQASCSLLITASRACDYAQSLLPVYSSEFWTIGQGAVMTVCGVVTVAKATRSHAPRKWRYPVLTGGVCCVGVGIYAIVESVGRLWTGVPNASFASRQLVRLDLSSDSACTTRQPVCPIEDAPYTFEQICKPQDHKSVLVMCQVANGGGDIGHCKKIFNFLEDSFPEHQVEIGLPVDVRPDLERYFPKAFSDQALFFSNYSKITTRKDDLVVDCPLLVFRPEIDSVLRTISNNTTPHLGITEFDYCPELANLNDVMKKKNHTQSLFFSSGLAADSIGLPFDTARYKAAAATSFDELSRLKNLCTLSSPGLRRAILDDDSCSPKTVKRFHKKYSLYPSYTNQGLAKDAFFTTILKVSKLLNETREPCFVFVGRALTPFSEPLPIPMEERRIFRDMRILGYNHIDLSYSSREKQDAFLSDGFTFSTNSQTPRSLRMVTLPYTSHENLLTLMSAGRIGQATGDQSAAEMFEAHLPFIYELLHHKTAFATAAAERAKQFDPELGKIMQDLMTIFDKRLLCDLDWRWDILKKYGVIEDAVEDDLTARAAMALTRLMKKPSVWNGFIKHLFEHHNEFPKIREVVKGYLSHAQQV